MARIPGESRYLILAHKYGGLHGECLFILRSPLLLVRNPFSSKSIQLVFVGGGGSDPNINLLTTSFVAKDAIWDFQTAIFLPLQLRSRTPPRMIYRRPSVICYLQAFTAFRPPRFQPLLQVRMLIRKA
jgi:hypothetical protein